MTEVVHQADQHRFVIKYQASEAQLVYRLFSNAGKPAIDFTSTFVPAEARGQGLAEKLVRAGIAWAKQQGYELHASCWYAAKFIR